MAKLHFKYGTMNSGKSMDLIRTIYNYEEVGYEVLLLKPQIDTKGEDYIVSRNGMKRKVDFLVDKDTNMIDLIIDKVTPKLRCIFLDEAQFLTPEQVKELFLLSKEIDIPVICYGLRNNFMMKAFPGSAALLELAEELEELPTLCTCGEIARYVGRKVDGEYATSGEEVVIDGANSLVEYVPMCGKCYLEKVSKINLDKIKQLKY